MITTDELDQLRATNQRLKDLMAHIRSFEVEIEQMAGILPKLHATQKSCLTCGHHHQGYCNIHLEDLPQDYNGPCDSWDWSDIPF